MDSLLIQIPKPYSSQISIKFDYDKDKINSYMNGQSTDIEMKNFAQNIKIDE